MHDAERECWDELDRDERIVRWCLVALIALLVSAVVWFGVLGAPAPLPKANAAPVLVPRLLPKHLAGNDWVLTWGRSEWRMRLSAGGDYACASGGSTWTGTWHVDAVGSFCVAEAMLDENGLRGGESRWSVVWEKGKSGINPRCPYGTAYRPDWSTAVEVSLSRAKP